MKIRITRKVILIGVVYLVICVVSAVAWDVWWAPKLTLSANITAGVLTIIGGFLLAYWLIESARFSRELERKKRVIQALKTFRNFLLPWLYHYACTLSTDYKLYEESERIAKGNYRDHKNYIPQLEDIFGIGEFDKNGKRLRGTDTFDQQGFLRIPLSPQSLYGSLEWGLRALGRIEGRIREFPVVLEEIDPEVAKIVHLSEFVRSRITELREWEHKHGEKADYIIDDSASNLALRSNLRTVGRIALNVVIAIDTNIERLEAEL